MSTRESVIDRLYDSMINDIEYKDLPETEKAIEKVKASILGGCFCGDDDGDAAGSQWTEMEELIGEVACTNEYQGFFYGFQMGMGLFVGGSLYEKNQFDEHIQSEYSSLAVKKIDHTDKIADILKEYIPDNKFEDAMDALCDCVESTKYAAFEQGILRGIAVAKSDAL